MFWFYMLQPLHFWFSADSFSSSNMQQFSTLKYVCMLPACNQTADRHISEQLVNVAEHLAAKYPAISRRYKQSY